MVCIEKYIKKIMTVKKIAALILVVVSSILLTLLILEGIVRLFLPPETLFESYGDTYICSPTLGWVGRPDYQGIISREEYEHSLQFNDVGMHDTPHTLNKTDDVFRILWVGDSFAQTIQVDETQSAHQQLENLLNEYLGNADRTFEVISSGVIGWGTGQELIHYRELGRLYEPDLVVLLFFIGNDVNDNLPGHALTINGFNCFAPYFPVCNDGANTLDSEAWHYIPGFEPAWNSCSTANKWFSSGMSILQYNSYLFARLEPLLLKFKTRRTYGQEFGLPFAALYLPQESEEVRYGWQVTEGILNQFDHEVTRAGAKFSVAIVGPREVVWLSQLTDEQLQLFYQESPDFQGVESDWPNRRLAAYLQSQNIPTLDLQQPMVDYMSQTGAELYLPIDRHWTVDGNRVVAELMFEWLTKDNLLMSPDNE